MKPTAKAPSKQPNRPAHPVHPPRAKKPVQPAHPRPKAMRNISSSSSDDVFVEESDEESWDKWGPWAKVPAGGGVASSPSAGLTRPNTPPAGGGVATVWKRLRAHGQSVNSLFEEVSETLDAYWANRTDVYGDTMTHFTVSNGDKSDADKSDAARSDGPKVKRQRGTKGRGGMALV